MLLVENSWWNMNFALLLFGALLMIVATTIGWLLHTRRLLRTLQEVAEPTGERISQRSPLVSQICGAACGFLGLTVLIFGWGLHWRLLTSLLPSKPLMYPATALGLALGGLALGIYRASTSKKQLVSGICATLVTVIGALTLAEMLFLPNMNFSDWLFRDSLEMTAAMHGRMAPSSAICFVLIGFSLLLFAMKRWVAGSQTLAGITAILCLLNGLAHLYGVPRLFAMGSQSGMAIHTIVAFLILCAGTLMLEPDRGLVAVLTSDGPGGLMARWLLPAAVLVPGVLGWIRLEAQFRLKLFGTPVGLVLFAGSNMITFGFLIWANADLLNRSDAARERARHAADHDILTSLLNRKGVLEILETEMGRARRQRQPLSIILVDIDHFKLVNDTLGHPAGDRVLKETARKFTSALRSYDSAGRFGGEEFLLVLPGCHLQDGVGRGDEIRRLFCNAAGERGQATDAVTVSMGVAALEIGETLSSDELIRNADAHLYEAKHAGRNLVRPAALAAVTPAVQASTVKAGVE